MPIPEKDGRNKETALSPLKRLILTPSTPATQVYSSLLLLKSLLSREPSLEICWEDDIQMEKQKAGLPDAGCPERLPSIDMTLVFFPA